MNGPWHCGLCGEQSDVCACGEPLAFIVRVPGCIAAGVDHDSVAGELIRMVNEQRIANYEGEEGYGPAPVRLLASGWGVPESDESGDVV